MRWIAAGCGIFLSQGLVFGQLGCSSNVSGCELLFFTLFLQKALKLKDKIR